ncbi:MAG TPA: hypothetical protein VGP25_16985 [Gemmatimonadaceae bacterium]|nr:hypothetical protein [Gemmatimonadaceae bacterium]
MKPTILLRTLSASALVALAARSASAQTAAQAGKPAAATPAAAPTPWPARPIGRYELQIAMPERVMPLVAVISDSAGAVAGVIQPDGDPETHPVKVTVKGTELFLNADAPQGAVEIVLLRTGDQITGRWSYGDGKGELKGVVSK